MVNGEWAMDDSLDRLIMCLSKLPGVGRKSAERMALRLARNQDGLLKEMCAAMQEVEKNVRCCSLCGNVTPAARNPCNLCSSPRRDGSVLCVVEDPGDILLIERSGGFAGRYHALMGKISPMRGDSPENLRIKTLLERIRAEKIKEVILALSTDVEGDSTAVFIADLLKDTGARITRLAFGLPAGSAVAYSDPITLAKAIRGRSDMGNG